jgi:hypothetical protein
VTVVRLVAAEEEEVLLLHVPYRAAEAEVVEALYVHGEDVRVWVSQLEVKDGRLGCWDAQAVDGCRDVAVRLTAPHSSFVRHQPLEAFELRGRDISGSSPFSH